MSIKCHKCNLEISESSNFCPHCGTHQVQTNTQKENSNDDISKYYQILGIDAATNLSQIEEKYKALSKEFNLADAEDGTKEIFAAELVKIDEAYSKIKMYLLSSVTNKETNPTIRPKNPIDIKLLHNQKKRKVMKKRKTKNIILTFLSIALILSFFILLFLKYTNLSTDINSVPSHDTECAKSCCLGCLASEGDPKCLLDHSCCARSDDTNDTPPVSPEEDEAEASDNQEEDIADKIDTCTDQLACNYGEVGEDCIYISNPITNIRNDQWTIKFKWLNMKEWRVYKDQRFSRDQLVIDFDFEWSMCENTFKMMNKSRSVTYEGYYSNDEINGTMINEDGNTGTFNIMRQGQFEVLGCTDKKADNYNPDATKDDGSCKTKKKKVTPPHSQLNESNYYGTWKWKLVWDCSEPFPSGDEITLYANGKTSDNRIIWHLTGNSTLVMTYDNGTKYVGKIEHDKLIKGNMTSGPNPDWNPGCFTLER